MIIVMSVLVGYEVVKQNGTVYARPVDEAEITHEDRT